MIDALGPGTILGYCTNVHPSRSIDEIRLNLDRHAAIVRQKLCAQEPMGVGLWFSDDIARQIIDQNLAADLRQYLHDRRLGAFTLNGFPFGDFHQRIVKQLVYEPDWTTDARLNYTLGLATILRSLIDSDEGSISTLPIGWPSGDPARDRTRLEAAARQLAQLASRLAIDHASTGKLIHIDIEPEPGCLLDSAQDVCEFFQSYLDQHIDPAIARRYLRVCHDVCHSAVMFEPQTGALDAYRAAGIAIGKVQLSSALSVDLRCTDRAPLLRELRSFAEDRYLHQTTLKLDDGSTRYFTDLPEALAAEPAGRWRIHFHVPVFASQLGPLGTTQDELRAFLALKPQLDCHHYEVETYAWNVLPAAHRTVDLASGIAREMQWVIDACRSRA